MKSFFKVGGLLLAAAVIGCGGGGGSSTSGISGTSRVGVFVTDAFTEDYDHVWTTIYKVELVNSNGTAETVFDDSAGRTLDLTRLHDSAGSRFSCLSNSAINAATHTHVRVTVGENFTLFRRGATTGQATPCDDSLSRDAQGHRQIEFKLTTARNLASGSDDVVIDFDLANFSVTNGKVRPALKEGRREGLTNRTRHEADDYKGTVSNLAGTAPNLTFTLATRGGTTFSVTAVAGTSLFNASGATNPTLANGTSVEVSGTFDVTTKRLNATSIKIKDAGQQAGGGTGSSEDAPQIKGTPSAVNATAGTFTVSTVQIEGLTVSQSAVQATTGASTIYRDHNGLSLTAAEFFAKLGAGTSGLMVEIEGSYDAASNTFAVAQAKIENEGELHGGGTNTGWEIELTGTPTDVSATAGTFTLPAGAWEGNIVISIGRLFPVVTTASTEYKDQNHQTVNQAAFFALLSSSTAIKVEGTFDGTTLTAREIKIVPAGSSTGGDNHGGGSGSSGGSSGSGGSNDHGGGHS